MTDITSLQAEATLAALGTLLPRLAAMVEQARPLVDNEDAVIALAGITDGLNTLAASLPTIQSLADNATDVVRVSQARDAVLTVAARDLDIQALTANLAAVQSVAADRDSVLSVAQARDAVVALATVRDALSALGGRGQAVEDLAIRGQALDDLAPQAPQIQALANDLTGVLQAVGAKDTLQSLYTNLNAPAGSRIVAEIPDKAALDALIYGVAAGEVQAGQRVQYEGNVAEVLADFAPDWDAIGTGGVKLRILPLKGTLLSRADNDLRMTDGEPDHRVKTLAGLATPALVQAAAVSDVVEVAGTGHRFIREGESFEPLESAEHTISLAQYDIDRTGNIDASDFLRRALDRADSLGGGWITLPPGRILLGDVETPYGTTLEGSGSSIYDWNGSLGRTALVRKPDAAAILIHRESNLRLRDMDLDGNGAVNAGGGDGLDCFGGTEIEVQHVKMLDFDRAIFGGDDFPVGGLDVSLSVFRQNNYGMFNFRDSWALRTTFSGNRKAGIYTNGGQNTIQTCFIEFQRGGPGLDMRSDGIYLGRNSNDIMIANCTFDRNAGFDIFGEMADVNGVTKFPVDIQISDCAHKGGAWGIDMPLLSRRSIRFQGGDRIYVTDPLGQTRSSEPSGVKGMVSPLWFADFGAATNVVVDTDKLAGITSLIEFDGPLGSIYEWMASATAGEWYLRDKGLYGSGGNPFLVEPNDVAVGDTALTAGTVGTLGANQYAMGDNDGLGYSTLYLRTDGSNPTGQGPAVGYRGARVMHMSSLVSYGGYRSVIPAQPIAAGASLDVTLHGPNMGADVYARRSFQLDLTMRRVENLVEYDAVARATLVTRRDGTLVCTTRLGAIAVDVGAITVGEAGSGSNLELSVISTFRLGKTVTLRLTNTTATAIKIEGGAR
ncbi:hypothetical protein [Palleronia sp.]|uniref:hypothetical protein n=1 Tax=Palleronia sp. TaxID=1940284 RepID=UPI0035C851D7